MATYDDFPWTSATDLKRLAQLETPWSYYLKTEVYIEAGNRSGTVRPADAPALKRPPLPSLHVISATQPESDPAPGECAARLAVLVAELQATRIDSIRAVGSSFSGDHQEESRAVFGLTDDAARDLGIRFGQVAIFSWNGPRWSLLACADDRQEHRSWQWGPLALLV
jgi:hypothetical protein